MNEEIKEVVNIIDAATEEIRAVCHSLDKKRSRLEEIRSCLVILAQKKRTVTVNPMDAPEVIGADKDGEGGRVVDD